MTLLASALTAVRMFCQIKIKSQVEDQTLFKISFTFKKKKTVQTDGSAHFNDNHMLTSRVSQPGEVL